MNEERGQSLLEFAILLPFLCLLTVGIVDVGRAAVMSIKVTNAATAGAEFGAQGGNSAVNTAGIAAAVQNDAPELPMTISSAVGCTCDPWNGGSYSGVSCSPMPAAGSCATISATCIGPDQIVQCVQVKTHLDFDPLFHWPGLPQTYQSNGTSVMRVRQ